MWLGAMPAPEPLFGRLKLISNQVLFCFYRMAGNPHSGQSVGGLFFQASNVGVNGRVAGFAWPGYQCVALVVRLIQAVLDSEAWLEMSFSPPNDGLGAGFAPSPGLFTSACDNGEPVLQ
jgi:hypothetical protein